MIKVDFRKAAIALGVVSAFVVTSYQGCGQGVHIGDYSSLNDWSKQNTQFTVQAQDQLGGSFREIPTSKLELAAGQNYRFLVIDKTGADFHGKVTWVANSIPSDVCTLTTTDSNSTEAHLICTTTAAVALEIKIQPSLTDATKFENHSLGLPVLDEAQLKQKGATLYANNCNSCHNDSGSGRKKDKTAEQISAAINNQDLPSMFGSANLKLLSTTELRSIAAFIKTVVPADTTKPTVAFVKPTAAQTVHGTIQVEVNAADETQLQSVELEVDMGTKIGDTLTSAPFDFSVDTTTLTKGNHTFKAIAKDAAGNVNTAVVTVAVDNTTPPPTDTVPPTVAFINPADGLKTKADFNMKVSASDNEGVIGVKFFLDGTMLGSEDMTAPFETTVSIAGLVDQSSHMLKAEARDAAGNKANVTASFIVDKTLPVVNITAPATGATVSAVVSVNITATDAQGIDTTFIKVDGVMKGVEDKTSPYSISLDTSTLTNGSHTLTAVARDLAGNEASKDIAINVSNSDPYSVPENELAASYPATTANLLEGKNLWTTNCASCHTSEKRDRTYALLRFKIGPQSDVVNMKSLDLISSKVYKIYLYLNNVLDTQNPTVAITSPTNGQQVSGTIAVTSTASDNTSVSSVSLQIDGVNYGSPITAAPYTFNVDTKTLSNANHTLKVIAKDPSANEGMATISISVNNTVITDTVAPTVSFTEPANNKQFNTTLTVRANATDNVGVAGVKLLVDGTMSGTEDTSLPYEFVIDAASLANGDHTIKLEARDAAGNKGNATLTVRVDKIAPTIAIPVPTAGQVLTGTSTVQGTASDANGVAGVQFQVDGVNSGAEDTVAPYSFSFNSTTVSNGNHTLKLIARDNAGNTASATVSIVTNNIDPYNVPESQLAAQFPPTNQNILAGKALAQTYNCSGCHAEKFGRNYANLRQMIGVNSTEIQMKTLDLISEKVYKIYLYLNFDLTGVSTGVEQSQMLIGTRTYVASYFTNIFVSNAGTLTADTTIKNLIQTLLLRQPGALGGACQKNDETSTDDTCRVKISETNSGLMLPSTNAIRRGYVTRACEEILSINQGVINALEKAALTTASPVDAANVAKIWDVFTPGRPLPTAVSSKLVSIGGVTALTTGQERWRYVLYSVCRAAGMDTF